MFTGDTFTYRSILTNDWQSSEKEVIEYYNQRGASEKLFDVMNNDFGWNHLPFSFMNENTAYLIIMQLSKNFTITTFKKLLQFFTTYNPPQDLNDLYSGLYQ